MPPIQLSDEMFRLLNELRQEVRTGRTKRFEPFDSVIRRMYNAYVAPGKD